MGVLGCVKRRAADVLILLLILLPSLGLRAFALSEVPAPGGEADSAESLLTALGGETAGWINNAGVLCLRADLALKAPIVITGGELSINGAGCMISRAFSGGSMIELRGGTLILGEEDNSDEPDTLILDGNSVNYPGAGSVVTLNDGTLDIYNGTAIQNGSASTNRGGGISVNGGQLNFAGGIISGCSASDGGGLYIGGGVAAMSGGQIKKCSADSFGGGIFAGGNFTMTGGTVGGTVTVVDYASGPSIETDAANSAYLGGGIYISGVQCAIGGGTVAANTAVSGGGAAVAAGAEAVLYSGLIAYNTASEKGGGVYSEGKITQGYLEISKNNAALGGGVWNGEGAEYTIAEGQISSNTSSGGGAGIYNMGGFTMTAGSVNYNETQGSGGGLINYGSFSLSGGSFGYNKAKEPGAEMLCFPSGEVVFSGAVFIGGDKDIALARDASGNEETIILQGDFTCTTKVARLRPVYDGGGAVTEDYKSGRVLLTLAENNKNGLDYYLRLFDVVSDSTGGGWRISGDGSLAYNLPGLWFWLGAGGIVVLIAATAVFVIKSKGPKKAPAAGNKNSNDTSGH